jgi:hypothetical protein
MDAISRFAILTLATIFAGAAAFAMAWLFLRGAFHLMQPATASHLEATAARRRPHYVRSELVEGTRASARQLALDR